MVHEKPELGFSEGRRLTGSGYGTGCILTEVWVSKVYISVKIHHIFH